MVLVSLGMHVCCMRGAVVALSCGLQFDNAGMEKGNQVRRHTINKGNASLLVD